MGTEVVASMSWGRGLIHAVGTQTGHMSRDCPRGVLICFHYNQTGHKRPITKILRRGNCGACNSHLQDHEWAPEKGGDTYGEVQGIPVDYR